MEEPVVNQSLHGRVYNFSQLGFEQGDVIVVTGAGSGIGRATAITAAASGLSVAVWDINPEAAANTEKAIRDSGGTAMAITVDVGNDEAVTRAWDRTAALGGPCRHLVNNAAPAAMSSLSFYDHLLLTVGSVHRVTMAWIERYGFDAKSAVNTSSTSGNFQGGMALDHYPAGKGGVAALTRHLAVKYSGKPRFNAVAPGFTITPRTIPYLKGEDFRNRTSRIPIGRAGYPEEIASSICFLLSPAAGYVNGVLLPVDGGWILA